MAVDRQWVVLDTETTGLDPARDEMTEMAVVVLDSRCQQVAGVAWRADDGHDVLMRALAGLNSYVDAGIVVAHNLLFDLAFLAPLALPASLSVADPPRWLCTMRMTGRTMTLGALASSLGVVVDRPHTAAGDSRALAKVLASLIRVAQQHRLSTIADLARVSPGSTRPLESSAELFGGGWVEVAFELDHVIPLRPISRDQRDAFAGVCRSVLKPDGGPAGLVEIANTIRTLRASDITRSALEVLLDERRHAVDVGE